MDHRPAALIAAAGFAVEGASALAHRELSFAGPVYHHLLDTSYALAMVGAAVAVVPLGRRLAGGRAVVPAAWVARVGFAAMGIESAVGAVHRVHALGPLFTLGIALSLLGGLGLAIGSAISGRPRWAGSLPLVSIVVAAAGGELGASLVSAAAWVVVASRTLDGEPEPQRATASTSVS